MSTADVCRKHGISSATFYAWKAKFGGMDVSEAKRLKSLQEENAKLKRLLADAMLDNVALKDLLGKNSTPAAKREAVAYLATAYEMSERRACRVIQADRKLVRYRSRRPADPTALALRELAGRAPALRLSAAARAAAPRGTCREPQEDAAALSRGGPVGAPRRGRKRATGTRAPLLVEVAERALVGRLRPRPVRLGPALSHPQCDRRRHRGIPCGDPGHLDLRAARGTRAQ